MTTSTTSIKVMEDYSTAFTRLACEVRYPQFKPIDGRKSIGEKHGYQEQITQRHNSNLWHMSCGWIQLQWQS